MIGHLWKTIRPVHWIKNVFVFAPLFFSGHATELDKLARVFVIFLSFSAMASAVYCFNDIMDRERDRSHPKKCKHPIASGALPLNIATFFGLGLAIFSLALACSIAPIILLLLFLYGVINITYGFWLKNIVILDVFFVSSGFVLRVLSGGVAINVEVSSWLIVTTFLLALFLSISKRRHELVLLADMADNHRPVLNQYTVRLADEMISVVTPVILITYILYTLSAETLARFNSKMLYITSIFVVFGIMRYLYLIHRKNLGDDPTELVIHDIPLLITIFGWILSFYLIIYTH